MHEYVAEPGRPRHRVVWYLAGISVAISAGIGALFHVLHVPTFIAPPAGTAVFGVLFLLFDKFIWRLGSRTRNVSGIPNLRGTWKGGIDVRDTCKPDEPPTGQDCTVKIKQTWTRISIDFKTNATKSSSVMASFGSTDQGNLHYEYDVEPLEREPVRHCGTAHLEPASTDWSYLSGKFYNDEQHQRWGLYHLKRDG